MAPFTMILGVVLGSLASIAFSLSVVMLVFWLLRDDHPRFLTEMPEVIRGTLIFYFLAASAAASFVGSLRGRPWRFIAFALLGAGLLSTAYYYWPE